MKRAPLLVRDCTGKMVEVPYALRGPELYVAWADTRSQRQALDRALEQALESVAARHRAAVWAALRDGWQPGEYDRVRDNAIPSYERALEGYARSMMAAVDRWTQDEARRQASAPGTATVQASPVQASMVANIASARAADINSRIASDVGGVARSIANRVQDEVRLAAAAGKRQGSWSSAIAPAALAVPARAIGQIAESEGRVAASAALQSSGTAERLGLQIVGVVRTSVNDGRRCARCTEKSGTRFELPLQARQMEAMPLPDPECAGTALRCRCGWLIEWGKVDRMQRR